MASCIFSPMEWEAIAVLERDRVGRQRREKEVGNGDMCLRGGS